MTVKPIAGNVTPEAQLRAYINKLDPKNQKLFSTVRAAVRKRFPTANDWRTTTVTPWSSATRGGPGSIPSWADCVKVASRCVPLGNSHVSEPQLPRPKQASWYRGSRLALLQGGGAERAGHTIP